MSDEPIFSILTGKPEALTLTYRTVAPVLTDGVRNLQYSTVPNGTTQLRITINSITYGAPSLTGTPTYTIGIDALGSTTYSEDANLNVYLLGQGSFINSKYIYAGHRDFATNGTITLEALDASNNVLAIGTFTGNLSSSDDD